MSNFFKTLVNSTKKEKEALYSVAQIQDALKGDISLDTYISYLTEAYHHVKHTTPLLMAVGSRVSFEKEFLRNAIAKYIDEELGHQEWILNDIKNCGGDAKKVRNSRPKIATELMIAYAYDSIMRKNPISFFGMVFVLEGTSTALATNAANSIKENLKLNKNCFSYLFSHGSLDLKHMDFFAKLINQINDEKDQADIIHMAKMMFHLFADVFRAIPHKR